MDSTRWGRHLLVPALLLLVGWVPAWNFVSLVLGVGLLVAGAVLILAYARTDRSISDADDELYCEAVKRGEIPGHWL